MLLELYGETKLCSSLFIVSTKIDPCFLKGGVDSLFFPSRNDWPCSKNNIFLSLLSLGGLSIPLFFCKDRFHLRNCVGITLPYTDMVSYCTFVYNQTFDREWPGVNNKIFIYKLFCEICLCGQVD